MSEAAKLDAAFDDEIARAQYQGSIAYIIRSVALCIDKGIIDAEHATRISVSAKGMTLSGRLNFTEDELRSTFNQLLDKGYLSDTLYYNMVFNGIVSRGETLH